MAQDIEAVAAPGGRQVRLTWPDGETRTFPAAWLFDHASEARDATSGQRRHGARDAARASVQQARIEGGVLRLEFHQGPRSLPLADLREADRVAPRRDLWLTPAAISAQPPIRFDAYLRDDAALAQALDHLARRGLVMLTGAGDDPQAVVKAVARFGFVRETNYGAVFDVRVEARPRNIAYSDLALDLHTDNPYRDPVPTLQLLHAIEADRSGGGATAFVDGFAHAEALRREAPQAFERLARQSVRFSFAEASGARWQARMPVLQLDGEGALQAVRLNHRSLDLDPADAGELEEWYEAYLQFYETLHAPAAAFERRLETGDLVIFDNRRILHGRRAFDRSGARWLRGAYADADGLHATLARLRAR
jgi:gamma-butyrobetaine dioxygenase